MNFNARLEMDKLNKIMKKRGLEDKGRVQKFIDSEVIKLCGPYTPFQTGTLQRSALIGTITGSGTVIYDSNYGKYLYYGKLMISPTTGSSWAKQGEKKVSTGTDLKYDGAPKRGSYWFERMKADHLHSILKGAAEVAGANT